MQSQEPFRVGRTIAGLPPEGQAKVVLIFVLRSKLLISDGLQ